MKKNNFLSRIRSYAASNPESVLICAFLGLCLVCATADRFLLHRSDEFLGSLIYEIIILAVPLFIYLSLTGRAGSIGKVAKQVQIRKISYRLIFLPIIATGLLIFGSLLLDMLFFGMYDITGGFTLYGQFTANGDGSLISTLYMILTFAIIPAVFEEIVFRRLLTSAHAKKGILPACLISGIFFALTPFSVRLIPSFLFMGMIYCVLYTVTGSLVTSISAHILFNLYGIFLRTNIANYFVSTKDAYVLVITALVAFLIFGILFTGMLSKLFVAYAKTGKTPPETPQDKAGFLQSIRFAFGVFKTPTNLACVIIYAIFIVIFAFFG